tara:strand:- start:432 stop:551 length:120 start_codon:yes stop_codon:yes gene_type:complete
MILREMLQEDIMSMLYKQFFLPIEMKGKRLKDDSDWVFV